MPLITASSRIRAFGRGGSLQKITATGGTIATTGLFTTHTFTSQDTLTGNSFSGTGYGQWFSPGYFGVDKGYVLTNGKTYTSVRHRRLSTGAYYFWILFVTKNGNDYTPSFGQLVYVPEGGTGFIGEVLEYPFNLDNAGNGATVSSFGSSVIPSTGTYYLAWLSAAPGYTAPSGSIYVDTYTGSGGTVDYVSTSTAPSTSTTYTVTATDTGSGIQLAVRGHDSNFSVTSAPPNSTVEVLVVAGGGGSGSQTGGGGGGGGVVYSPNFSISPGNNYSAYVGRGGGKGGASTSGVVGRGTDGGNSTFSTLTTAVGGGAGGSYGSNTSDVNVMNGSAGGSGGGGNGNTNGSGGGSGGAGTSGQGFAGGAGNDGSPWYGGGGGGFSSAGTEAQDTGTGQQYSGQGGAGYPTDISGTFTYHSTGGGGCGQSTDLGGFGGSYGWGSQGGSDSAAPSAPQGGYGHGGGGTRDYLGYGGTSRNGEGGVIIIKYPTTNNFLGCSSSNAAASASAIKSAHPTATNGVYWISIGGTPTPVYCDMTTDGGGWMLYGCKTTPTHITTNGSLSGNAYTMLGGDTNGKVPSSSFTQLMWRFANISARPYVTKYVKADDVGSGKSNWNSWIVNPAGGYSDQDVGGWYRSTNGGSSFGSVYRMNPSDGGGFYFTTSSGMSQSHSPSTPNSGTDLYLDLWSGQDSVNNYIGNGAGVEGTSAIGMKSVAGYTAAYEPVWFFWKI